MAAVSCVPAGSPTPIASASATLTAPATRPLTEAIQVASASATLRVRLLSIAQAKHAPRTASEDHGFATRVSPGQLRITAPATIMSIPNAIRRSKFSRNANQASSAVKTLSALSKRETDAAGRPVRASINSTGPTTPPAKTAPASQGSSDLINLGVAARMTRRNIVSPTPEPRYSNPANIQGFTESRSSFARGVPAPNSSAAPRTAATPGSLKPSSHFTGCDSTSSVGHGRRDRQRVQVNAATHAGGSPPIGNA